MAVGNSVKVGKIWDFSPHSTQVQILINAGIPAWQTGAYVGIPWKNLNDNVKRKIRGL